MKLTRRLTGYCALGALLALSGCAAFYAPLDTVASVDINRYAGQWYEIARYPNGFETDCVGVTATYTLQDDGRIEVLNKCIEGTLDGPSRDIVGSARAVDETNARLRVSFFQPFEGDYWILELGDDYEYAVVGEPSRSFLWILSRTPQMDDDVVDDILSRLPERDYDPERLEWVLQASE